MKKIISALLALLIAVPVYADTCGASLTGVFTSFQATKLCSVFGSAVNHSLIPSADNTYDLGSSSLGWQTAYIDTSVVTPLVSSGADLTLRTDADAQRVAVLSAASDTAVSLLLGDGTAAAATYTLSTATIDTDDDATLQLGFSAGTRGAGITLPGEEVAGGSDITYNAGTSDSHIFQIAAAIEATLGNDNLQFAGAGASITGAGGNAGAVSIAGSSTVGAALGASAVFSGASAADGGDLTLSSVDDLLLTVQGTAKLTVDSGANSIILGTGTTLATASTITSSATGSLGWSVGAGANTACNTTCTSACVTGIDTLGTGGFLACTDATADFCLCAGAS